jgi:DNA-binding protein
VRRAAVLERLPDLHAGAREVVLELQKAVVADAVEFCMMVRLKFRREITYRRGMLDHRRKTPSTRTPQDT